MIRSRVVILMTTARTTRATCSRLRALAADGVSVFVVGIGSSTGEPIPTYAPDGTWTGYMRGEDGQPVLTSLTAGNEEQLREIARLGHGRYFRAERGGVGVEEIRRAMRGLRQEEQRSRRITVHEDRYALVLLPAFLLILLEALLPDAWVGRFLRRKRKTP